MDVFFNSLTLTMAVVMAIVAFFARPMLAYRARLREALHIAALPDVKKELGSNSSFRELHERAMDDYATYDVFWIPFAIAAAISIIILWAGLSLGIESSWFITLTSIACATLITRGLTMSAMPEWLMDWIVAMCNVQNQKTLEDVRARAKHIDQRLNELLAQVDAGQELTEAEQLEVVRYTIEHAAITTTLSQLEESAEKTKLYYKARTGNDLPESD